MDALQAEVDALKRLQAETAAELDALLPAILDRAFKGELISGSPIELDLGLPDVRTNVIDVRDLLRNKAALSAYYVSQSGQDKHRGRVKMEKFDDFVEGVCGLDLARNPRDLAAGPADMNSRDAVEAEAQKNDWYSTQRFNDGYGKSHYEYFVGKNISEAISLAEKFMGNKKPAVDRLIKLLKPLNTHQCSVVATLRAAWSKLQRLRISIPDKTIIKLAISSHSEKQTIPMSDWNWGLEWLRKNDLFPKGQ